MRNIVIKAYLITPPTTSSWLSKIVYFLGVFLLAFIILHLFLYFLFFFCKPNFDYDTYCNLEFIEKINVLLSSLTTKPNIKLNNE